MSLSLLGVAANAHAAAGGNKDWKGDNGNSNDNTKWLDGLKPGRSDVVKVTNGKMNLVVDEVWGALDFQGGTIDGAKKLELLNVATSSWTGGDFDTVTVTTSVGTSFTIGSGSTKNLKNNARFNNIAGSTTTWSGSDIATGNGAQLNNAGTFTVTGSGKIAHNAALGGSRSTLNNTGNFTKHTDTGTSELETVFNNTGNVTVSTGKLKLAGGGTSHGNMTVGTGGTLELAANDYAFNGGTLDGSGTIDITSAVASFNGTTGSANLKVSGGSARLDGTHQTSGKLTLGSGSVTGTGQATVGSLEWTGGTLDAKVSSAGGTLSGGIKTLSSAAELTLTGNATWDGSTITVNGPGKIKNEAGKTFSSTADGAIANTGTGTFTNLGTFEKSGGGPSAATDVQVRFESSGEIKALAGTLKLSGGGHSSNNVTLGSDAKLEIAGADFAFTGGAINGASGKLQLSDKTTTFTNSTSGSAEIALTGSNATAKFDGTHTGTGKLNLASGTVAGTGTAEFGALDWSGGSVNGKIKSTGTTTIGGNTTKSLGGELTLAGQTTWDGNLIQGTAGAKIKNEAGATFSTTADGLLSNGGNATFTNAGTFEKNAGSTGGATEIRARFENTGSLKATTGTLKLSGGGASSGHVNVGAHGKLQIADTNYAFENATFTGDGTLELAGATTKFKGSSGAVKLAVQGGSAEFDTSTLSASTLTLGLGTLTSTNGGGADVSALEWTGGTLNARVKSGGAALNGGAKTLSTDADLTLGGTTSWDGSSLAAHGNAKIRNETGGTFLATADGTLSNSGAAVFTNNGTFTKSGGNGATRLEARFDNNGVVTVNTGKLHLAGGGKNGANGSIAVATDAILEIASDLELFAGSELAGNGLGRLLSGTFSAHGDVRIKHFDFEGGSLAGNNTFHGTVNWHGSNWNSSAAGVTTTIAAGGVLNLRSSSSHDHNRRSIVNHGTVNWHAGNLRGGNGGTFINNSVFNDLGNGDKSLTSFGGASSFVNNGEYRKTHGGITTVDVPFANNGLLKIAAGSMVFASTFINHGAINVTNGATATFDSPLSFGLNAPLSGVGTITAPSVTAAGEVAPGVSPGSLHLTGDLTLLETSALLIELGGPIQGTDYDFLSVGGSATLDGSLKVTFLNGYQWLLPENATFTILNASGGLNGAFANVAHGGRLSTLDGAATFQVNYGLNSVVLSNFVVAVPEPSTYAMLALGGVVILLSLRRRKK